MLLAAPFIQAALAVSAAALFRPVRRWVLRGGLRHALLALVAVTGAFELLRTTIHG